jgi:hypothetical protein
MIYHCNCGWRVVSPIDIQLLCPQCAAVLSIQNGVMTVDGTGKTQELSQRQLALKARIEQAVARDKRLHAWIIFFRTPAETGLGDTIKRLTAKAGQRAIKADLVRLAKTCGCKAEDATKKLNEQYPY